jgi:hypothetical protein
MILLRRFLVLCGLLFWQGGLAFYTTVVIPVGHKVLGSFRDLAPITRQATWALNLAGAVALLLLAWDLLATRDSSPRRRWARGLLWLGLLLSLLVLAYLHHLLERRFDPGSRSISEPETFSTEHSLYVSTSLAQGLMGLAALAAALWSWLKEDREGERR